VRVGLTSKFRVAEMEHRTGVSADALALFKTFYDGHQLDLDLVESEPEPEEEAEEPSGPSNKRAPSIQIAPAPQKRKTEEKVTEESRAKEMKNIF